MTRLTSAHLPLPGRVATEAEEQVTLFRWAQMMSGRWPELDLLHAIPNGGSRNPVEAKHLKAQGVKAGIPDLFLPVARGGWHGLYIEMKRREGGRVRPEQRMMLDALKEQGYRCEVCKGWEEAKNVITEYMTDDETAVQGMRGQTDWMPRKV